MKAIGTFAILALALGVVLGAGYFLLNSIDVSAQQTLNTSSNNITINFTLNNSIANNTMFFTNRPLNITLDVRTGNISGPTTIQFATLWIRNGTGELVGINLTNDTTRTNTSDMIFYNGSAIILGSNYDSVNVKGADRNVTISVYNISGPGYEWLNDSVLHMPFNISVNEYAPNKVNITMISPVFSTTNGTEIYTRDLNFTINTNVSITTTGLFEWNDRTAVFTPSLAGNRSLYQNSTRFNFFTAFNGTGGFIRNVTFYADDAFGNRTFFNNTQGQAGFKYNVQVNEFPANTTIIVVNYTDGGLNNQTIFNNFRSLNISTNTTVSVATAILNQSIPGINLSTYGTGRIFFGNTSVVTYRDTLYLPIWDNVTWFVQDAFGNTTWFNRTNSGAGASQFGYNGTLFFSIDTTNPTLDGVHYGLEVYNNTGTPYAGGNFITVVFNVSENNIRNASVILYLPDNTTQTYNATLFNSTNATGATITSNIFVTNTNNNWFKVNVTANNVPCTLR